MTRRLASLTMLSALVAPVTHAQLSRVDAASASPLADRIVAMEATVNTSKVGTWPFVERQGRLYAGRDALEEWRVQLSSGIEPIVVRGASYLPLSAVPGYRATVNHAAQAIEIVFAPEAFSATNLVRRVDSVSTDAVLPSAFFNYDLNLEWNKSHQRSSRHSLGALTELGLSNGWGVLTSSQVMRTNTEGRRGLIRLESTFTRHMPQGARTLRVGDAAVRPGLWGSSVYFGGFQLASNYGLNPGFVTQPLPLIGGVSAAPSTVQLYVNDVLQRTSDVPAGPFVIDNLAGVSGSGEAKLVVRDVLGREVVIVQPYFTSGQLLAKGLADWSVEAGALREDIGRQSNAYGQRFAAGTWRYGLGDRHTMEGRAEVSESTRTAGVGVIGAAPMGVLARAAMVRGADRSAGSGTKWVLGAERQWTGTSFFLQAQGSSRGYVELGRPAGSLPSRLEWVGSAMQQIGPSASLNLSLAGVRGFDSPAIHTVSANYIMRVGQSATVSVNFSRAVSKETRNLFGVSVSIPLGPRHQVQSAFSRAQGYSNFYLTATGSSGPEVDLGWRVLAGRLQQEAHSESGVYYGGRYGRLYSDLSASREQTALRSGAAGAVVWAANQLFATQRVDQSFAVVEVKGLGDVGVGLGSNVMTATNADGIALVPLLTAYQGNQIRLNAADLPISAEVESIEKMVVPPWRSAVKVDFPVRSGRAALLKIVFDDGQPAPAGAVLQIEGDKEEFYVARRGEAYVTALQPANTLRLTWKKQTCRFPVLLEGATADDVIRLGPLPCAGVGR